MGRIPGIMLLSAVWLAMLASASLAQQAGQGSVEERLTALEQLTQRQAEVIAQQQRVINTNSSQFAALETKAKATETAQSWLAGLKFMGDLRLRFESVDDEGAQEVNHGRFRLRFGVEKQITETVLAGFRLASGSSNDPTSTNQTFTTGFAKKDVWIDLAYVIWKPAAVKNLTVGAGKVKNPFITTDMIWDSDVNPEGAFANYFWQATDCFKPFVTAGGFLVNDQSTSHDANMAAVQAGWDWTIAPDVVWTLAGAYSDWFNVEEPGNFITARGNTSAGGVLTAGDFDVVDVYNAVTFPVMEKPLKLFAHAARNVAEDAPAPDDGFDTAWGAGFVYGLAKDKGDWQVDYVYKNIEANAVVGRYADSDFGFANRKGHVVGLTYMFHKNVSARLAGYFTQPEAGADVDQTVVHADLVFKI